MPVEVAEYITDLNPSFPRGTDGMDFGDDHIRLVKKVIKNCFPNFTPEAGRVVIEDVEVVNDFFEQYRMVPSQVIIPYHGTVAPVGWAICDGTNGTPNLKNRFIVGATLDIPKGTAGGSNNIIIPNEDTAEHVMTLEEMPAHTHKVYGLANKDDVGSAQTRLQRVGSDENSKHGKNVLSSETGGDEAHSHGITYSDTLSKNVPEYYTLLFIMKE